MPRHLDCLDPYAYWSPRFEKANHQGVHSKGHALKSTLFFHSMQSLTTHSLLDDVWSYNWSYDWGLMIIYLPWPWSLYKLLPCVCFLCSFFRVVFYPLNNKVIMLGVIIISSFKKFLGNEGEGYVDSTLLSYVSKSCSNRGNAMWNASSSGGSKASLNGW